MWLIIPFILIHHQIEKDNSDWLVFLHFVCACAFNFSSDQEMLHFFNCANTSIFLHVQMFILSHSDGLLLSEYSSIYCSSDMIGQTPMKPSDIWFVTNLCCCISSWEIQSFSKARCLPVFTIFWYIESMHITRTMTMTTTKP